MKHETIMVSKEIFAYLKCLKQFDTLWDCVFNELETKYGSIGAATIMYEDDYDKFRSIRSFIEKQLCMSIETDIRDGVLIIEGK